MRRSKKRMVRRRKMRRRRRSKRRNYKEETEAYSRGRAGIEKRGLREESAFSFHL